LLFLILHFRFLIFHVGAHGTEPTKMKNEKRKIENEK
jgi:hypothetical protein